MAKVDGEKYFKAFVSEVQGYLRGQGFAEKRIEELTLEWFREAYQKALTGGQ